MIAVDLTRDGPAPGAGTSGSHRTIALCGLTMIVEGFDTYAIGYVGPAIAKEWAMSQVQVGLVYSIGVAASLVGSVVFGGLADRFGRRRLLIGATILFGIATLLGAVADGVGTLIVSRLLAGIGLGASIPCALALATEAASERHRASVPVLMSAAIASGMIFSGLAAALIMPAYGWRGLMAAGGIIPLLLVAPMYWGLIETRQAEGEEEQEKPWRILTQRPIATLVVVMTLALFGTYLVAFFMSFWLPSMLTPLTADIQGVGFGMMVIKTASLLGSLTVAALMARVQPGRLLPATFLIGAVALALGLRDHGNFTTTVAVLAFISFFIDGAFSGIIGFGAWIFPSRIRATAIGVTTGMGRFSGGTLGPMAGGMMLDRGFGLPAIATIAAMPLLMAGLLVAIAAGIHRRGNA